MAQHNIARQPAHNSLTQTQTESTTGRSRPSQSVNVGILRLRGEPIQRPSVSWDPSVIDNSNMNKKKSKVCCIYHKPRAVDESSSESSSSSSGSDSDSEPDNSTARMGGKGAAKRKQKRDCDHHHNHADDTGALNGDGHAENYGTSRAHRRRRPIGSVRSRSPNAYEKMKPSKSGGSQTTVVAKR